MTTNASQHTQGGERPHAARRVRGVRASWLLLVVALVPLIGVFVVTATTVRQASDTRETIARTEELAMRAVLTTQLDGALFDEMIWNAIDRLTGEIGLPEWMTTEVFGGVADGIVDSAARADEYATRLGDQELIAAIAEARAGTTSFAGSLDSFTEVRGTVGEQLDAVLSQLSETTGESGATARLRRGVDALRLGIELRAALADSYVQYFATIFDLRDAPAVELAGLISTRTQFVDAIEELSALVDDNNVLGAEISTILAAPALVVLGSATDELIAESLSSGLPDRGVAVEFGSFVGDGDGLVTIYRAATESSVATLELLDASSRIVLEAAAELRAAADRDAELSYLLAVALLLATLAAVVLASRFVVRPLRHLQRSVDALQTGELEEITLPVTGPIEAKAAALALQDAAEHFSHVTRQARALAAGDLDAEVLDHEVTGGLGGALQTAVGRLRSALAQQEEFRQRLAHEASHDGLTQIPNRNASMAQLQRSLARTQRSGSHLAVLFIDLDRFKDVNDHHGHQAGDSVLREVAHRLLSNVREGDHVGRLGGDEFMVVAEPVDGLDDAVELAERLMDALAVPIDASGIELIVGASIGIALADDTHLSGDELLRDADLAVYRAKQVGRNEIGICDEELRNQLAERADLSTAIRRAVDFDEFVVHYQPIVSSADGRVQEVEALVRWMRPGSDRPQPPSAFIDFAERSAMIIDIDRWVIDAVAAQLAQWQQGDIHRGIPVAINVSGRHLAHERFVDHVLEPLRRHGVDPGLVIVELTESALLDDLSSAGTKLRRLRDAGVRISIDDFGTGFTSLSHLRALPVDILKIDRSFTATAAVDPHEASIVKLIIETGHLLGASITAEGIETEHELERLTMLGSDSLQGYYFDMPRPPESLAAPDTWTREPASTFATTTN